MEMGSDFVSRLSTFLILLALTAPGSHAQTFTTLHNFSGPDGEQPEQGLIQAFDGNLYGTTIGGGASGQGTLFRITPAGALTTIYQFCLQVGCADGIAPMALVQATNGDLSRKSAATL